MIAKCRYLLKAAVLVVSNAAVLFMAGCGKPSEIETPASGRGGTVLWMQLKQGWILSISRSA